MANLEVQLDAVHDEVYARVFAEVRAKLRAHAHEKLHAHPAYDSGDETAMLCPWMLYFCEIDDADEEAHAAASAAATIAEMEALLASVRENRGQ